MKYDRTTSQAVNKFQGTLLNRVPGCGLGRALLRVELLYNALAPTGDLADEPAHVRAVQGEGGPGPVELVPPGEQGDKVDDAAGEDRPELLAEVRPVTQLGHEDAEDEVVAEGAEHEPVLVAVGLAQFVQESGCKFTRKFLYSTQYFAWSLC